MAAVRSLGRRIEDGRRRRLASALLGYELWQLPGHYYSPLPEPGEALAAASRTGEVRDVDLRVDHQHVLLDSLRPLYRDGLFPARPTAGRRFYHDNDQLPHADAILLSLLLQHWRPERIVEIGSGYSTAVMLDTIEQMEVAPQLTCIEPYPSRLRTLLRPDDQLQLIEAPVQSAPAEIVEELQAGDVLFIDSTHVVKTGSDVVFELFELLPRLAAGVRVHFHDICWPFEYPRGWVQQGRAWNEVYAVHAFLAHNDSYRVELFVHQMLSTRGDWFASHMSDCLKRRPGAPDDVQGHGLWLVKQPR